MNIEKCLIHPNWSNELYKDYFAIWHKWASESSTRVINNGDTRGLDLTSYLEQVTEELTIGGQTFACVSYHLLALAMHPKVREGVIGLIICQTATAIKPSSLTTITDNLRQMHVNISVTR